MLEGQIQGGRGLTGIVQATLFQNEPTFLANLFFTAAGNKIVIAIFFFFVVIFPCTPTNWFLLYYNNSTLMWSSRDWLWDFLMNL